MSAHTDWATLAAVFCGVMLYVVLLFLEEWLLLRGKGKRHKSADGHTPGSHA